MGGAALAMLTQLLLDVVSRMLGIDFGQTQVLWPLTWFCVSAMLAVTVDWRMLPMTVGFLGALFLGALKPEWRFYGMGVPT